MEHRLLHCRSFSRFAPPLALMTGLATSGFACASETSSGGTNGEAGAGQAANAGAPGSGSGGSNSAGGSGSGGTAVTGAPNIIVILADDLGYGDLSSYGNTQIETPNIDRLAAEGQRWTDFYATSSICSPSRSSLLTGRHQVRIGTYGTNPKDENDERVFTWVFMEDANNGMPQSEVTLAEVLGDAGYKTSLFGKWHLGHELEYMPHNQGFDYYYGVPFSNNISPLEFWRNDEALEEASQDMLTRSFTEEATKYIRENKDERFFMYFAHTAPHRPFVPHLEFRGKSGKSGEEGRYLDVVLELDWSVGQVVDTLEEVGIAEQTLVIFASDNGPALYLEAGSSGILKGGKGGDKEGGFRVPAITWWPGTIEPGQEIGAVGTLMDIFPTAAGLAGAVPPDDRIYDSVDLGPVLKSGEGDPREVFHYYHLGEHRAIRKGDFKLKDGRLYNLRTDPGESDPINNGEVKADLLQTKQNHLDTFERADSLMDVQFE